MKENETDTIGGCIMLLMFGVGTTEHESRDAAIKKCVELQCIGNIHTQQKNNGNQNQISIF